LFCISNLATLPDPETISSPSLEHHPLHGVIYFGEEKKKNPPHHNKQVQSA